MKKSQNNELELDNLISVPVGSRFVKGIVKEIKPDLLKIESIENGNINIPNNKLVYKMFPGQRYDLRELNSVDPKSEDNLTIKEKLDKLLSKTKIGSFDKLEKGEKVALLTGKMTNKLYEGQSLVLDKKTGEKNLKNFAFKFKLSKDSNGVLKIDPKFKREKLSLNVYGEDLTEEQASKAIDKKETLILDRESKSGLKFKTFARFDKDLNTFVTIPYDTKVEKRILASQKKKENLAKKPTTKIEKPVVKTAKKVGRKM